jgi:hypothetical protein
MSFGNSILYQFSDSWSNIQNFGNSMGFINSNDIFKGVSHYYRKHYARRFENDVGGGQEFQPPRLMSRIN